MKKYLLIIESDDGQVMVAYDSARVTFSKWRDVIRDGYRAEVYARQSVDGKEESYVRTFPDWRYTDEN